MRYQVAIAVMVSVWVIGASTVTINSSAALTTAINAARAGDTILVRAGAYSGLTIRDKVFSDRVVIKAYPGEEYQQVFVGGTYSSGKSLSIRDCRNITIAGLTFKTALWVVMIENSHYITLKDCKVHDAGQEGVVVRYIDVDKVGGSSHITIADCEIYDTGKRGGDYERYGEGIYVGDGRAGGENDTTNTVLITGCTLYRTSAEAIDLKRSNFSYGYVVDGNTMYDIATNVRGAVNVAEGPTGNERGYVLRNNRIWNVSGVRYASDGVGIRVFGVNVLLYNNVVTGCSYAGIVDDSEHRGGTNYIYNNTCFGNGGSTVRNIVIEAGKSTVEIKNNIGLTGGTANIQASDALFVNALERDLRLRPTASAAIDRGVTVATVTSDIDGTSRPAGGAYDIGAYEFVASTHTLVATPRIRAPAPVAQGVRIQTRGSAGAVAPLVGVSGRCTLDGRTRFAGW